MAPKDGLSTKERKAVATMNAAAEAAGQAEAASWEDNDKGLKAKSQRAQAKEEKSDSKLKAKQERKVLEEAEEERVIKVKGKNQAPTKVTHWEIAQRQALAARPAKPDRSVTVPSLLIENTNHMENVILATGIDAAIGALDTRCGRKERRPSTGSLSTVASVNDVADRPRRGHKGGR